MVLSLATNDSPTPVLECRHLSCDSNSGGLHCESLAKIRALSALEQPGLGFGVGQSPSPGPIFQTPPRIGLRGLAKPKP